MSLFEKNVAAISQRNAPDFIAELNDNDENRIFVGTDQDGTKIFCNDRQQPFIVEPTIDETQLPNVNLQQLIFFFGMASLEEIRLVAKHANPRSLFVIIEPNSYFLQYALEHEDFSILDGINYILVTEKPNHLTTLFKLLFTSKIFYLSKNILFYLNNYYRKYDAAAIKAYIAEIGPAIKNKYFTIGNSIHDSLIGLINNLNNISSLSENVDVASLKNVFTNVPAFVVAAGPSLDRNIHHLKKAQGKGLIIAVDTIVQKLIDNGIVPDFICTVERGAIVWEYFYENKKYPDNMYLVSSLVADPRIVSQFKKRAILPMRSSVREYFWLSQILGLTADHYMWMGASCAHIAMGLALHVGASPVVMVGQDLAYGEQGTHANGTVYAEKPLNEEDGEILIPGYFGSQVRTRKIWLEFKQIFENLFDTIDREIINATEGGAKINGTKQRPLAEMVEAYCTKECHVAEVLSCLPKTNINWVQVEENIRNYTKELDEFRENVAKHLSLLNSYLEKWSPTMSDKRIEEIYENMKKTDRYYQSVPNNLLLMHNVQGPLTVLMQKFHGIEETDSLTSLKENLLVQIELCEMLENTAWLILEVIEENFPWVLH